MRVEDLAINSNEIPVGSTDSDIAMGRLDNGLRWVVRRNEESKGEVNISLAVMVGSAMESPNEKGYAHFIEHMAFQGTTHCEPGQVVKKAEALGIPRRGINANTSEERTLYYFDQVPANIENIRSTLLMLADFAHGMIFPDDRVESEKRPILQENLDRNENPIVKAIHEQMEFMFGVNHPLAAIIGGTAESVSAASSASLRSFYEKWYVAPRMIVTLTGDFDLQQGSVLIKEIFSEIPAHPMPIYEPDFPLPPPGTRAMSNASEDGMKMLQCNCWKDGFPVACEDLEQVFRTHFTLRLLQTIFSQVFLNAQFDSKQGSVEMRSVRINDRFCVTGLRWDALCVGNVAQDVVREIARSFASLLRNGISEALLNGAKTRLGQKLRKAVEERKSGRMNLYVVHEDIDELLKGRSPHSPKESLRRWEELSDSISAQDVMDMFRQLHESHCVITYTGSDIEDSACLMGIWNEVLSKSEEFPPISFSSEPFPYLPPAPHAELPVSKRSELTIYDRTFGVRVFQSDNTIKLILVPSGHRVDGEILADLVVGESGTIASGDVMEQVCTCLSENDLVGKVNRDAFIATGGVVIDPPNKRFTHNRWVISGSAPSNAFSQLLEAIRTAFVDTGLNETEYSRCVSVASLFDELREKDISFLENNAEKSFFKGVEPVTANVLRAHDAEMVDGWLRAHWDGAPATLILTGDFDEERVAQAAYDMLSSLPVNAVAQFWPEPVWHGEFPAGGFREVVAPKDPSGGAIVVTAWGKTIVSRDGFAQECAVRSCLQHVLTKRLFDTVRDEFGLAYSTSASDDAHGEALAARGDFQGVFRIRTQTKVGQVQAVRDLHRLVVQKILSDKPVTDQEVLAFRNSHISDRNGEIIERHLIRFLLRHSEIAHSRVELFEADYEKSIRTLTPEIVQLEAEKLFSSDPAELVIRAGSGGDDLADGK